MNIPGIIGQAIGHAVQQAGEHAAVDDPEVRQAMGILGRVQQHLYGKWRDAQHSRVACAVRVNHPQFGPLRCTEPMMGACVACTHPVCLEHASVTIATGDAICFACIELVRTKRAEQPRAQAPPPGAAPSPEDEKKIRRKHMRALGLKGHPTEKEIQAAFRNKAAKTHPDKAKPGPARDKAHHKFVALGTARDWLIEHRAPSRAA